MRFRRHNSGQVQSRGRSSALRQPVLPEIAYGAHPIDALIAWVSARSKMFSQGWGDESVLAQVWDCVSYTKGISPADLQWSIGHHRGRVELRDGSFPSPLRLLPAQTGTVHLRSWTCEGHRTACVFHAASRDEGYQVRERVFGTLIERGIDLYFLENPFYGKRRTTSGPSLGTVSDHVLMSVAMVCEARALLEALRPRYDKLVIAGYSMGGHMAAITAAVNPFAVGCAALATGASASAVYTRGMLRWSVDLDALAESTGSRVAARQRLEALFQPADITEHPAPLRPEAATIAGCTRDGYVLQAETFRLHQHWPGSRLHWVPGGHFSALLTCRREFCDLVAEAAARL